MSVVVTGVGVVSAAGAGFGAFRAALEADAIPPTEVDREGGHHRDRPRAGQAPSSGRGPAAGRALLVPADAVRPWLDPMKARRMSLPSRASLAAARMALEEAGLGTGEGAAIALDPALATRAGVSLGTAFGSSTTTQRILDQCLEPGPEAISPFLFTESVANAPAGQVALALGIQGPNATVTQGEASVGLAVARGADYVRAGRADVVLAGGFEECSPLLHAVLDRFGALTRDVDGRARPFDGRREGFVPAEGAVVAVLESEAHAAAREATPLVRLLGWSRGFDPSAAPGAWGDGAEPLAGRARAALDAAGVEPSELGGVVSGASGAIAGDALEAGCLAVLLGPEAPPILAPKGVCGEYGGFQWAAAIHAALGGRVPDRADDFERDPRLDLRPGAVAGAGPLLVTQLAAGGPAAWLVVEASDRG